MITNAVRRSIDWCGIGGFAGLDKGEIKSSFSEELEDAWSVPDED